MIIAIHGITASSRDTLPSDPILTINITGLPEDYEVYVDDVLWPDKQKSFPAGTVFENFTVSVAGYVIDPISISSFTLDSNTTLDFTATEVTSLLPGNSYLNLNASANGTVVQNIDNVWSLTDFGTGRLQPLKMLGTDGEIVVEYDEFTKSIEIGVKDNIGFFNADNFNVSFDGSTAVTVNVKDGISESLPTQPVNGQFIRLRRIGSSLNIAVEILSSTGSVVYTKTYTAEWISTTQSHIQFEISYTGDNHINYPQGKNLTTVTP